MSDLTEMIETAANARPFWAALLFALIAFGESTAFVGMIVPATPALLLVGGLLGAGRLDAWQIIPTAVLGAILGYGLSYTLGRAAGRTVLVHRWVRGHRRGVARARLFFRKYGPLSLIFGRFVLGPFQSLLPFVAGGSGMAPLRFWTVNLVSSALWVPLCLAPGYFAAKGSTQLSPEWEVRGQQLIIAVSVGAALICLAMLLAKLIHQAWRAQRQV